MKLIIFALPATLIITIIFSFSISPIFVTAQQGHFYFGNERLGDTLLLQFQSDSPEGGKIEDLKDFVFEVEGRHHTFSCFDISPGHYDSVDLYSYMYPIGRTLLKCVGNVPSVTAINLSIDNLYKPTTNPVLIYILLASVVGGIGVALFLKFRKRSTGSESDVIDVK